MTATLEARSLCAGYGARTVVRDVSFVLEAGRTLAVVGPNAAGKSSLLHALCGALSPLSGDVLLSGTSLRRMRPRERARRLALVPQAARYDLDFSVRDMVALGRAPHSGAWGLESRADREAISRAIAAAHLEPIADRPFAQLSGGERQRVLFARALAQQAPLLLLDEPTAHLDLAHQLLVLDEVRAHARAGGAGLVVLHDLSLAARLDRVAVMEGGRIVALGEPADVLTPERLAETWGIDALLERTDRGPSLVVRGRRAG